MSRDRHETEKKPEGILARFGSTAEMTDRGLLVEWLAIWCLAREMARSKRTGSPLSVAVLTPLLFDRSDNLPPAVYAGAMALKNTVRGRDVIAWHDTNSILAIMPDTSGDHARVAVERWCAEMWKRCLQAGGMRWTSAIVANAANFEDTDAVLWEAKRLAVPPLPHTP